MDVVGESFSATTKRAEVRIGKISVREGLIENLESHPVWDELGDRLRQFRLMCENLSLLAVA